MGFLATAVLTRGFPSPLRGHIAPGLLAAALGLARLVLAPPTPDLAAQVYRAEPFDREGFTLFNANWYGGHHTPAYSILFPPLGALLGVRVVGVVAAVASAVLFERIARRHFGESARWGALWFGAGTAADLLIGRVTFAVGVAFALAAVFALQRGHRRSGVALASAARWAARSPGCSSRWPAGALAVDPRRSACGGRRGVHPGGRARTALPEGGSQPYTAGTLASIVLCCVLLLCLLPRRERALRSGALLYLAAAVVAFAIATPMGGNASRLGVAFAGPVLLCAALASGDPRRRRGMLAAMVLLLGWQWWAPVRETIKGAVDPSGQAAYFAPLLRFVDARAEAAVRVEVPFTRLHWESVYVARDVPLARGWVTQLDVKYNPLFRTSRGGAADARALPALAGARGRAAMSRCPTSR